MKKSAFSPALFLRPVVNVVLFTYLVKNLQLDDALIYLRYLRNYQEGFGLVYNPGDRFNGLTSPLYTAVTLLASHIISSYQVVIIGLSAIFLAISALIGGHLFSRTQGEALFTASVIACCGYFYMIFGMETMLFLLMISLSLYCYRKESPWFVIVLALLVSTRSEGIFLAAPMALDYLIRHRRLPDWRFVVCGLAIFLAPFIFNQIYYGEFLPATGSAKIAQGRSGLWGESWAFFRVSYQFHAVFGNSFVVLAFFGVFSLYGMFLQRRDRSAVLAMIFAVLLLLFYVGLNIPNYPWYYAPFFYLMLIFTCRGLWHAGSSILLWRARQQLRIVAMIGLVLLAGFSLPRIISIEMPGPHRDYVDISYWLQENTSPDAAVAMVEIGTIGWYSRRPIVDILGLVNEYNADYIGRREFLNWIGDYQPDYILRHEPVWGHESSVILLESKRAYTPVTSFNFPGFVLLEKSDDFSRDAAIALVRDQASLRKIHEQLSMSATPDPARLRMIGDHLFSHAPSSLSIGIENPITSLDISYGVEQSAAGLHYGICFEVVRESDQLSLLQDCITADAEDLARTQTIYADIAAGDRLVFNNSCQSSCDYGWSYWGEIYMRPHAHEDRTVQ